MLPARDLPTRKRNEFETNPLNLISLSTRFIFIKDFFRSFRSQSQSQVLEVSVENSIQAFCSRSFNIFYP